MSHSDISDRTYPRSPMVGVGVVIRKDDEVLLVKRGQEPLQGVWTVPGGLVHVGETLQQAAQREILEECSIRLQNLQQFDIFEYIDVDDSSVKYHYIIVEFVADYLDGVLQARSDVLESRWLNYSLITDVNTTEATRSLICRVFQI